MIVIRTPLRMSFVGGGSDLPNYYRLDGGAVISTTIDKYIYTSINKKFDQKIKLSYSRTEDVDSADQIEHQLLRETLIYLNCQSGIEINTVADIPANGTGLGSSSAFVVSLLHGLYTHQNTKVSPALLAETSSHLEIDICRAPIGKQDQYAVSYGGLNLIEFKPDETVSVTPIQTASYLTRQMEDNLIFFYTGITRSASHILKGMNAELTHSPNKRSTINEMVKLTYDLKKELENNNSHALGYLLHENWLLKKSLYREISSTNLDTYYQKARQAGALGGKILGAGGGGFFIFYADPSHHVDIIKALSDLKHIPVNLESDGSQVIYDDTNSTDGTASCIL